MKIDSVGDTKRYRQQNCIKGATTFLFTTRSIITLCIECRCANVVFYVLLPTLVWTKSCCIRAMNRPTQPRLSPFNNLLIGLMYSRIYRILTFVGNRGRLVRRSCLARALGVTQFTCRKYDFGHTLLCC
jgi:hypothetical protein